VVVGCGVEVGGVAASPSVGSTWGFADRGEDFCGLPVADDLQHEQEHRLLCFNHYNVAPDPEY
jgi:hypothetical protein